MVNKADAAAVCMFSQLLCAALSKYECVCAGLVQQPHVSCLHAAHMLKQICEQRQGTLDMSITKAAKAVPNCTPGYSPMASAVAVNAQKRCCVHVCLL